MMLGYHTSYSEKSLLLFLWRGGGLFFFSIRPSDPKSGNAFDAKRKKKGGVGGGVGVSELH